MPRHFPIALLSALISVAAFILPGQAAGEATHRALRSSVRAIRPPRANAVGERVPTLGWVSGSTLPVAVTDNGGGAGAGDTFYVPGGFKSGSCETGQCLNDTVQLYVKSSDTWTNDTADPIPPVNGLKPGLAESAVCYDPAGEKVHIINGLANDSVGHGYLLAQHLVYDPAAPAGSRLSYLSYPVDSLGNVWQGQSPGCAFIGGELYLFGGYGVIGSGQPQLLDATWVYDPATDSWSDTGKRMQHRRAWMGYTTNGAMAFVAGGSDLAGFHLRSIAATEEFSPTTGWKLTALLPKPLLAPGEGLIGTHLVVWGGGDRYFVPQNRSYGCTLPSCSSFTTLGFILPSAKWFSAFGSGSSLYNAGGNLGGPGDPVNTTEHLP